MNAADFVYALKVVVRDAAGRGTMDLLQSPPGRRPDPHLVQLSQWFLGLAPRDRLAVASIVELATNQATYNFLLALDGLLTLEPDSSRGKLELYYAKGEIQTRLNQEEAEPLSVIFKG
jgi:hypothetical protein